MTDAHWRRVERLLRWRVPVPPNHPWWEDVAQEGRIAAMGREADPDWLLAVVIRRRMIDAVRSMFGRDRKIRVVAVADVRPDPHHDPEPDLDPPWQPPTVGDERLDFIIRRLSEGATNVQISKELGLHPSRVSQLLVVIRQRLKDVA